MTPLIPLPDPTDDDQDVDDGHATTDPRNHDDPRVGSWRTSRRRLRVPRPRRKASPYIATPAPAGFDRELPAGDMDDQGLRTTWDHADDRAAAADPPLQISNVSKRHMDSLPGLIAHEQQFRAELRSLIGKRESLLQQAAELRGEAQKLAMDDPADRRNGGLLRQEAARAESSAAQLERYEREVVHDLNRVSQHIDTTPDRIYEEVAIIIGHHDRNREVRQTERPERWGVWTPPGSDDPHDPGFGVKKFIDRYGPLPIDTRDELAQRIERLRERCQDGGNEHPTHAGNPE